MKRNAFLHIRFVGGPWREPTAKEKDLAALRWPSEVTCAIGQGNDGCAIRRPGRHCRDPQDARTARITSRQEVSLAIKSRVRSSLPRQGAADTWWPEGFSKRDCR
jgi:hypothetical protein